MSFSVRNISAFVASLDPAQRRYFLELEAERAEVIQATIDYLDDVIPKVRAAAGISGEGNDVFQPINWDNPRNRLEKLRRGLATVLDRNRCYGADQPEGFTVDLDVVYDWARCVLAKKHRLDFNDRLLIEMGMLRKQARQVVRYCQRNPGDPRSKTILRALAAVTVPEAPSTNTMAQAMFGGRWGWLKDELNGL